MPDTQMFLDRGPESFLGEVISLVKVRELRINNQPDEAGIDIVRVEFKATIPDRRKGKDEFTALEFGRSYGQALRKIREALRLEIGR